MKPIINLDLNGTSNAVVVIDADRMTTCMDSSPKFSDPETVALVTNTKTANVEMRKAVAAPVSETKMDKIRIAREILDRCITMMAFKVQMMANAPGLTDLERLEIIHDAGMVEKDQGRRQKNQFTVKNDKISGTVKLTAKGKMNAHEWQYTTDIVDFKNRVAAKTTTDSRTKISNLVAGTKYAFFHLAVISKTDTDWEDPIIITVT